MVRRRDEEQTRDEKDRRRSDGARDPEDKVQDLSLSLQAKIEATHFLKLLNEWTNTSVQGDPVVPLGKRSEDFGETERHRMFINDTGFVPTHMPWIILSCVSWMEKYPCQSSDIYLVDGDVIDILRQGRLTCASHTQQEAQKSAGYIEKTYGFDWFETRREADPFNGDAEREDLELDKAIYPEESWNYGTATE
eukprot:202002-Amphidinium_carterae.2